ncbi:hypothetical protein ANRL4_01622 [Anaerolineae bacterium]|nr:hypothetical protein ANRL4_01622 [Anaerolineae bacterium]
MLSTSLSPRPPLPTASGAPARCGGVLRVSAAPQPPPALEVARFYLATPPTRTAHPSGISQAVCALQRGGVGACRSMRHVARFAGRNAGANCNRALYDKSTTLGRQMDAVGELKWGNLLR